MGCKKKTFDRLPKTFKYPSLDIPLRIGTFLPPNERTLADPSLSRPHACVVTPNIRPIAPTKDIYPAAEICSRNVSPQKLMSFDHNYGIEVDKSTDRALKKFLRGSTFELGSENEPRYLGGWVGVAVIYS